MYISNATGCSSIWGGPAATAPYTVNKDSKQGPAWLTPYSRTTQSMDLVCILDRRRLYVNQAIARFEKMAASDKATDEFRGSFCLIHGNKRKYKRKYTRC